MRRTLLVLLLLAAGAAAQDAATPDPADLLKQAKARLEGLGETEEDRPGKEAVEARIALLEELIRTRKGIEVQKGAAQRVAERKAAAEKTSEEVRTAVAPDSVWLLAPDELGDYEKKLTNAQAERDRRQRALDALRTERADAETESKALPDRRTAAEGRVKSLVESDELTVYKRDSARIELTVVDERERYLGQAKKDGAALLPVLELELDIAKARFQRAQRLFESARLQAARLRADDLERTRRQAEAEKEAAEKEPDALRRFERTIAADAKLTRAEAKALRTKDEELAATVLERKKATERLKSERDRFEQRVAIGGEAAAGMLSRILDRTGRSEKLYRERTLPQLNAAIADIQSELIDAMDLLWELQLPSEENARLKALLEEVPEYGAAEARRVFADAIGGKDGLIPALRDKTRILEQIDGRHAEITVANGDYEDELDRFMDFVVVTTYWVRSDPPLRIDPSVLGEELSRIGAVWSDRETWADLSFWKVALLAGGLLLIAAGAVLAVRVRPRPPGEGRSTLRFVLSGLVLALLPSGFLLFFAWIFTLVRLPEAIVPALPGLLRELAELALVLRLAVWILSKDGIAVRYWNQPPAVVSQVLRSIRIWTITSMILLAPAHALAAAPFQLTDTPRLLVTLAYAGEGLAIVLLLRRRGAVVESVFRPDSLMNRLWILFGPLLSIGVATILVMDGLGYRVGADNIMRNFVRTLVAILLLVGLYRLLLMVIDKTAAAVRKRTLKEGETAEALENAYAVRRELSRLVLLGLVLVAFGCLMYFWAVGGLAVRALEGVQIFDRSQGDGDWLTLLDIVVALLWVVGGHVVVRNLGTLFEKLVFPMMTSTDRGSRFVWLTLSRYAIIVIVYSAAFVTLGFTFANLGWAFAAVSVGIGFGLQEVIANFISGLILLFERPIRVGDVITVGETGGTVDKINIRATTVTNWDRQTIIIPNKNFITQNLTNWTHNDEVIRGVIQTRVAFGSDVEKVLEILDGVVKEHPKVLRTPPHRIWFDGFGESSLDFTVWAFTSLDDRISTRSAIQRRIHQRLLEEGIRVPIPRRELHLSAESESAGLAGLIERREEDTK